MGWFYMSHNALLWKANKGKNCISLRNIPVSLGTNYILSSVTMKQIPGKHHEQSIPCPGLIQKAVLTERLTRPGPEPICGVFRAPWCMQQGYITLGLSPPCPHHSPVAPVQVYSSALGSGSALVPPNLGHHTTFSTPQH